MKVQFVLDLLAAHGNKFTVDQLSAYIRSQVGDKALERRTRRALFVTRKAGIILESIRDGGKAVVAYQLQGAIPAVAATATASKGSAKAKAPKLRGSTSDEDTEYFAAMAYQKAKENSNIHAKSNAIIDKAIKSGAIKLPKVKVTKASSESSVRAINAAHTAKVAKVKVDPARVSDEAKAAIKAKNLDTLKAVSAKTKGRLHPVTKRPITDEQATVLDEFAALEKQAELEEIRAEERESLRANAPSFLFKESYSE
jgi:hypothetical protein